MKCDEDVPLPTTAGSGTGPQKNLGFFESENGM